MYTAKNEAGLDITNWLNVWTVPAVIAAVILVLFMLFFKDQKAKQA
jgi:hypothetical protein